MDSRLPVDNGFLYLEQAVMVALCKERTIKNFSRVLGLLHPLLDYYIRFYMYRYGVHDKHPDFGDIYGETYCRCTDIIRGIKMSGVEARGDRPGMPTNNLAYEERAGGSGVTSFNRVKRYLNKSVGGLIYNRVYKKKKRNIEMTKDDLALVLHPDGRNIYEEVNYAIDLDTVEAFLTKNVPIYLEMYSAMFGKSIAVSRRGMVATQYRDAVFCGYARVGRLETAEEVFSKRYGRVFA